MYALTSFVPQPNGFSADTFDVRTGTVVRTRYDLAWPPGIQEPSVEGVVGSGSLMYVVVDNDPGANFPYTIATYDLSVAPPKLVGTILSNGGFAPRLYGTCCLWKLRSSTSRVESLSMYPVSPLVTL